jgi:steroid 5-alpha reductase family enzyme
MVTDMTLFELLLTNLAVIACTMVVLWLISIPIRNASIVDVFWGPAFAIVAMVGWWLGDGDTGRRTLLAVLTGVWGLRLGAYLALRNLGHGEDPRYARWRRRIEDAGGNFTLRSLAMVFGLQGLLVIVVSLPVQAGQLAVTGEPPGLLALAGTVLWLVGFLFEAIGDWQLRRFRADPANRGKLLETGLWRYTRHPNYFGNSCLWWGLWLIACDAPGLWWTAIGPALMTVLLLKVSGVALLEQSLRESKPQYADYVRRTSSFVPWPPRGA